LGSGDCCQPEWAGIILVGQARGGTTNEPGDAGVYGYTGG